MLTIFFKVIVLLLLFTFQLSISYEIPQRKFKSSLRTNTDPITEMKENCAAFLKTLQEIIPKRKKSRNNQKVPKSVEMALERCKGLNLYERDYKWLLRSG